MLGFAGSHYRLGPITVLLLLFCAAAAWAAETNSEPAKIKVSGYGFFGNRELKSLISVLQGEPRPAHMQANDVEDAILILFSRIRRDGYLNPSIRARATFEDGLVQEFAWTEPLGEPLPRPFEATQVEFIIEPGTLFYFEEIQFLGLDGVLDLREAAHFFMEADALIKLKKSRIYSPELLAAGLRNLEEALARNGYQDPGVVATNLLIQTNIGAVTLDIFVDAGPRSIVRQIHQEIVPAGEEPPSRSQIIHTNAIYSKMWEQDYIQALRREQFEEGHADVRVEFTQAAREFHAGTNFITMQARVFPGPKVRVGEVHFEGAERTKDSVMRRRVNILSDDLLNPVKAERGRYRLARLGIFDSVELRYDQVDESTRDVIYTLDEGKRLNLSLLAGYGSYDQLRAGFELEQYNLWGRGHHSRLKAIQSFKSSSVDYTYTMPELLGEDFDVFLNASGLRREEIAFTREEFGGGAGVSRYFRAIDTDLSLRYGYQVLNATRREFDAEYGLRQANVSSFIFDLRHDRRDNPLTPRSGYKVLSSLEVASEAFLGDVDFQRMESSFSFHHEFGRLEWIHFGLAHGFIVTPSGPANDLPFNRRFFPGGDTSIRGYQFGEAGSRDEEGDLVGSESYVLASLEFEQGLTRQWSLVAFVDALGQSRSVDDWPAEEWLYSVGGGIRWKTIIGPVRLEYGRNVNPREQDPAGTFHLSVGFPF